MPSEQASASPMPNCRSSIPIPQSLSSPHLTSPPSPSAMLSRLLPLAILLTAVHTSSPFQLSTPRISSCPFSISAHPSNASSFSILYDTTTSISPVPDSLASTDKENTTESTCVLCTTLSWNDTRNAVIKSVEYDFWHRLQAGSLEQIVTYMQADNGTREEYFESSYIYGDEATGQTFHTHSVQPNGSEPLVLKASRGGEDLCVQTTFRVFSRGAWEGGAVAEISRRSVFVLGVNLQLRASYEDARLSVRTVLKSAAMDVKGSAPVSSPAKTYKPGILRSGSLSALLVVTLVLIGLVELACQVLPTTTTGDLIDDVDDAVSSYDKRNSFNEIRPDILVKAIIVTYEKIETTGRPQFPREAKPQVTSAPNPDAFLQGGDSSRTEIFETIVSAPNPNAFLQNGESSISDPPVVSTGAPNPNAFLQESSTVPYTTISASAPPPGVYLQSSESTLPGTQAPNPSAYLEHPPTAPARPSFLDPMGPVRTAGDYFLGSYVPTLIAVLYSIPWAIIYRRALLLEPFYQLSNSQGAPASRTITRSFSSIIAPLVGLMYGEGTALVTTALMGLSLLITPLAPEAISIHTIGSCDAKSKGCTGKIGVLTPAARAIEGLLGLMALLTIWLIFTLRKRNLKLHADPSSIAGLATLFWCYDVRKDFTSLEPPTSDKQLQRALRTYRYRMETKIHPNGASLLGFNRAVENDFVPPEAKQKHEYAVLDWTLNMAPAHRLKAVSFFIFLTALAALIVVYRFIKGDNGFEAFMDSQGFGVRFLFTLIGVGINTALLAPYRSLAIGRAKAGESILMASPSHPLTALYPAIKQGQIVLSLITTASILAQVLTITIATIPFDNANSWNAYVASTWICVSIIGWMLLILSILFFYREPNLPLKPNTIAANLFYLCGSRLPELFSTMGSLSTRARDQKIEALNYRYCLAKVQGMDGVVRVTVDAEG
ncbi:hypothetical protein EJ04DRAFT_556957 [Polyplosphaeria fusca]|uniref:Uncharacterized protein n=1 Tax=Polyplosphaeria fusca TaxID=682080 RepID=A0A9P4QKF9_9PLEO|nr:hypothetical protein EJ04DRAFT_556957 [Polyplosphaeria fusca]